MPITIVLENGLNLGLDDRGKQGCILGFEDPKSGIQVQIPMNQEQRGMIIALLQGRHITPVAAMPDDLLKRAAKS